MKFHKTNSDLFIPSGNREIEAFEKTTHLAIGAHQDDVEIFAYHGILQCFQKSDHGFGAVIVTDGAGSARVGRYAEYGEEDMKVIRSQEQRKAAIVGDYEFVAQLGYPSREIKDPSTRESVDDLLAILNKCQPRVLYLHNPADKHETHVAVLAKCLAAVRQMPRELRPDKILGCEVWRDLDWISDTLKIPLAVGENPNLGAALLGVFDSQISGGKRYDLATDGRRLANATFFQSHAVDECDRLTFAIDLTGLFHDDSTSMADFMAPILEDFSTGVTMQIKKFE